MTLDIPLFTFGRYRNWPFATVLQEDPAYICWAYRCVDGHAGIPRETYAAACAATDHRRLVNTAREYADPRDYGGDEYEEQIEGLDYPEPPRCWGDLDD